MLLRLIAMKRILLAAMAAFLVSSTVHAQGREGTELRVNGVQLTVGGRLHAQFNTTDIDGEQPSEVILRRARIEIGVKVNDVVSGVIQPDFGMDRLDLKDAYVLFTFDPAFQVLAGKAYRPFGLIERTSTKRILPIERGLRIRGLQAADEYALLSNLAYTNRDVGFQIIGAPRDAPLDLEYEFGLTRGPLYGDVGAQDSYQFAAHIGLGYEGVRLGGGWSSRDFSADDGDTPTLERGHAFEVDLEIGDFDPGFHLLAEVSRGDLDPFQDATFWGAHAWLAYRTERLTRQVTAVEPVIRASYSTTEVEGGGTAPVPGGTLVTPGLNVYFGDLNRIMVNYDLWMGQDDSPDARSWKVMFQLGF